MIDDGSHAPLSRHYAAIQAFIRRRSATPEEAEDLTQAVFADVVEALNSRSTPDYSTLGLLYTVARRRLADRTRARKREERRLFLIRQQPRPAESIAYPPDIVSAIGRALDSLPPTQRDVVILKLLRGLTLEEIADRLGMSVDACKMRFSRAMRAVRASLETEGVSP